MKSSLAGLDVAIYTSPFIRPLPFHGRVSARFVAVREMSTSNTSFSTRAFQLRHDPLTGDSEWIVVKEGGEGEDKQAAKHLLSTTSYLDMLIDSCRNRAFRAAIEKTIKGPCHVLDIG